MMYSMVYTHWIYIRTVCIFLVYLFSFISIGNSSENCAKNMYWGIFSQHLVLWRLKYQFYCMHAKLLIWLWRPSRQCCRKKPYKKILHINLVFFLCWCYIIIIKLQSITKLYCLEWPDVLILHINLAFFELMLYI